MADRAFTQLRRMTCAVVGMAALGVAVAGASASTTALPRATADRPDDLAGPQIHVVYAVPSDGEDRHLDDNGTLEGSVASFQAWLAQETGGPALRMDTYQGSLDVTFARLAKTEAELAALDPYLRDGIEDELQVMGFTAPGKLYAVYYDGLSNYACGGASWPPVIPGNVVAMYLRGLPTQPVPCSSNVFARADQAPSYWEYAMLHDLLHGLGFVPQCAPNHHRAGHVTSPNNDLMWAGDVGHWEFPAKLDVGRDDYYGHGRGNCLDLAVSPYLTGNAVPPEPEPPPVEPDPPPAPDVPARPRVVAFTTTKARSGGAFRAVLRLDARLLRVACTARAGKRKLKATRAVRSARAECSWRLPRNARGKRLIGSVTATAAGGAATRKFSRRIS
jgi:hypothetical protein